MGVFMTFMYRRPRKFKHPISKVLQYDLLGIHEVTFFYVGDLFCIHLDTKYANFQEKISAKISGKNG